MALVAWTSPTTLLLFVKWTRRKLYVRQAMGTSVHCDFAGKFVRNALGFCAAKSIVYVAFLKFELTRSHLTYV